jgi:hypothetical protein
LIAVCDWQASFVTLPGHVNDNGVSGVTVKLAEQVLLAWQVVPSVSVQVTVMVPPQADGACFPAVSAVSLALHPPPEVTLANQVANWPLTLSCDSQVGSIRLPGQVRAKGISGATLKVAEHVLIPWQPLGPSVNVHVTVMSFPPQAKWGANLLKPNVSATSEALHPPV